MKALHMAFLLLLVGISFVLLERRGETGMLLVMAVMVGLLGFFSLA